ncbi:polysaccharide biosynthesis protein [Microbulbifer agarilyticus]|uniref:polysaccharide biosynthesis protein n=1 Tax=Microbulbifer agarilyticus TaxID=260552 RepID=UPI001C9776D3|nr:polysaccharide biosynthesis protein [Microbulbifer agarilyticus]MBY6189175.1 polysaccharide biosynthesis protein [Microbulbifer agarilyticus]
MLVTGACGTVGRALCEKIAGNHYGEVSELVAIDNNESELFFLQQEITNNNAHFYIRDLRHFEGVRNVMEGVDVVFHCAALKHVTLCEMSPTEAVETNIVGLQNLILAAKQAKVERFIFTSSDKAVNPTNVMGTSKLMGERLVSAANNSRENKGTIFSSTRFGNVLGSRGSVVPIFEKQILDGKDITLTSTDMTRFVMTIEEAADLVLDSGRIALGGEVFITKMPVVRIEDLAHSMIDILASRHNLKHDYKVIEIGIKPGEKLYEELMSEEEMHRSLETERYFVVTPAFKNLYEKEYKYEGVVSDTVDRPYISSVEPAASRDEVKNYLLEKKVI